MKKNKTGGRKRMQIGIGNCYWDSTTEQSVIQFVKETNEDKRNEIFNQSLYEPLRRLCEATLHRTKTFQYLIEAEGMANAISDGVCFLYNLLPNINLNKGKAFSYCGLSIRNYYINSNNTLFKKYKKEVSIEDQINDDGSASGEYLGSKIRTPETLITHESITELNYKEFLSDLADEIMLYEKDIVRNKNQKLLLLSLVEFLKKTEIGQNPVKRGFGHDSILQQFNSVMEKNFGFKCVCGTNRKFFHKLLPIYKHFREKYYS